ncbi:MAG: phosphatidate cytidylyltransferase [Candidatus Cloacimonetes bacterium]|nr:phosphatidate cytidylyltransferase [Candidatus Cloacimonadota bacterium]
MKFVNRFLVSLIFVPVMLLIFHLGGVYMYAFLGILALMMLHELRDNYSKKGFDIPVTMLIFGLLVYVSIQLPMEYLVLTVFTGLIITSGNYLFKNQADKSFKKLSVTWFSIFYIAIPLSLLMSMRSIATEQIDGRVIAIALLIVIWITDTMAYVTGMLLGKRKGIIKISPNKSVEGYIGGLFFALIGSAGMVLYFDALDSNFIWMLALSGGLAGQFGDLFESMLKRDLEVKDSSGILMEHGGILDRFDSLLFAAPALYILLKFMRYF